MFSFLPYKYFIFTVLFNKYCNVTGVYVSPDSVTQCSHTPQPHTTATLHSHTPQLHSTATLHSHTPQPHTTATLHSHTSNEHAHAIDSPGIVTDALLILLLNCLKHKRIVLVHLLFAQKPSTSGYTATS